MPHLGLSFHREVDCIFIGICRVNLKVTVFQIKTITLTYLNVSGELLEGSTPFLECVLCCRKICSP